MATTRTARERAREEITGEILAAARRQLASSGPAQLSLRAVAREVGMVSSAVYRYFPSRDELLTALLVQAYDELGVAVENADDAVTNRDDYGARWVQTCRAARTWAVAHPHEYALLYGSPVTGYAAPQDTIVPATRVVFRLVAIIMAALPDHITPPDAPPHAPEGFAASIAGAAQAIDEHGGSVTGAPPELVGRTLMAWSAIFGAISFELWGHLVGSVSDHEAYFEGVAARLWHDLGGR